MGYSSFKRAAQLALAPVHLAGIGFVIVSHQVQHAMKNEDTHLLVECAAEAKRVAPRHSRSDRDIAQIARGFG